MAYHGNQGFVDPAPPGVPSVNYGAPHPQPVQANTGNGQPVNDGYNAIRGGPAVYHSPRGQPLAQHRQAYGYPAPGPPPAPRPSNLQIVQQQPQSMTVVVQPPPERPSSYFAFSIVVCLLCNPLCGTIALCMSCGSQRAAEVNDLAEAKKQGKRALGFNIAGIVLTIVGVGVGVAVYFTVGWGAVMNAANDALNSFS